jgi:hypothetical protein
MYRGLHVERSIITYMKNVRGRYRNPRRERVIKIRRGLLPPQISRDKYPREVHVQPKLSHHHLASGIVIGGGRENETSSVSAPQKIDRSWLNAPIRPRGKCLIDKLNNSMIRPIRNVRRGAYTANELKPYLSLPRVRCSIIIPRVEVGFLKPWPHLANRRFKGSAITDKPALSQEIMVNRPYSMGQGTQGSIDIEHNRSNL